MSYQNVFRRYELKYLITKEDKKALLEIMNEYMKPDEFGKSNISNIYFDTPYKLLIRRSLDKPYYKEKLRVRSYGVANPDSTVFIEIKKKFNGVVYKRRINLNEKTATNYLVGHIPLLNQSQISKEIDYLMNVYGNVEPSVLLSYDREAFFSKIDQNFRMTFDENILMRDYDLSLTSGIYGRSYMPEGKVLLEVKTVFGIPKWLLCFLSGNKIYKTSFSKYGNAYMKFMLPKFLEDISLLKKDPFKKIENIGGVKNVA